MGHVLLNDGCDTFASYLNKENIYMFQQLYILLSIAGKSIPYLVSFTKFASICNRPEGIEALCSDLEVDTSDLRILMLAW